MRISFLGSVVLALAAGGAAAADDPPDMKGRWVGELSSMTIDLASVRRRAREVSPSS